MPHGVSAVAKPTATLAYWAIRGLAQPIRLLLEYCEIPYEDRRFEQGPPPDFDKSCWFDVKETVLGDYPFANLPFFIDGDLVVTQSNAIVRHIARKKSLLGSTADAAARVDIMLEEGMDLRNRTVGQAYRPPNNDYEAALPLMEEALAIDRAALPADNYSSSEYSCFGLHSVDSTARPQGPVEFSEMVRLFEDGMANFSQITPFIDQSTMLYADNADVYLERVLANPVADAPTREEAGELRAAVGAKGSDLAEIVRGKQFGFARKSLYKGYEMCTPCGRKCCPRWVRRGARALPSAPSPLASCDPSHAPSPPLPPQPAS